ncbi:P-loop containing nucleoside triphosphate hydrolase protein [Piromyces finnis]|uniref:p-loop containing nucleoside triphosphate hydrolase protein n=1 Tax=Piromyces finnis TaxID=1754191 RepID=A0A1Y1VLF1_9FUNG|nr:P-loop containing nucleoside triphosphate hydrolase protein [Piromyces finnis]|eukprot:ORX59291.1 P-loop containing nucleoside triphosphate hydrolase protein [Piromyces finnis]
MPLNYSYFNSSQSPFYWELLKKSEDENSKNNYEAVKNNYTSMDEYIKIMKPLFFLEAKEPFRDFCSTINKLKTQKNNWVKYLNGNAVEVILSEFKSNKRHSNLDDTFFNFKVKMPYYFIDGYNGMDYEKIKEDEKGKRSSGEIHRNDLIYLAKVSDDYKIVYYETLAFVEHVYNDKDYSDYDDSDTSSKSDLDYDDAIVDNINSIIKIDPNKEFEVKCAQLKNESNIKKLKYEIYRTRNSHWICIHVMSFGSVCKEYKALMTPKSSFISNLITTGNFDNINNRMLYRENDSQVNEITRKIINDFNLNQSQSLILEKVWNRKFSMIQGPPGTGKTTIIKALIKRHLKVDKEKSRITKILVCAPSNFACDEIYDRLEKDDDVKTFRYSNERARYHFGPNDHSPKKNTKYEKKYQKLSKEKIENYLEKCDVIISTLCSSGNKCIEKIKSKISLLIIDEACQGTELTTLIPLCYDIPQIVLIGDHKQLPPTVINKIAEKKCHYDLSFFERLQRNSPDSLYLLDTQYRMHPKISVLASSCFYNKKIADGENVKSEEWIGSWCKYDYKLGPVQFFNISGKMGKGSISDNNSSSSCNESEATQVLNCVVELLHRYPDLYFNKKIAIISPYNAQVSLIKRKLIKYFNEERTRFINNLNDMTIQFYEKQINLDNKKFMDEFMKANILDFISVLTVDGYQGQESDIVILSTVRSRTNQIGFLRDKRRLNVAITRARKSLIIFGNSTTLKMDENWNKVINDIKSMGCFTEEANNYFKFYHSFPKNVMPKDFFEEVINEEKEEEEKKKQEEKKKEKERGKIQQEVEKKEIAKLMSSLNINESSRINKTRIKKQNNMSECFYF